MALALESVPRASAPAALVAPAPLAVLHDHVRAACWPGLSPALARPRPLLSLAGQPPALQFQDKANGEALLFNDADGTRITVLDFYGLKGDILGSVSVCIGFLCLLFLFFVTCGMTLIKTVRHERR